MCNQELNNRSILITGGLGFIGLNLARVLIENYSCRVIIVDDCSNSSLDSLSELHNSIEFYNISVSNKKKIVPFLKEANYIFHFATKGMSGAYLNPEEDMQTTVTSTLNILEYLRKENPSRFGKLIFTSSSSIYGNGDSIPFSEKAKPEILSNYAATKYLTENYIRLYHMNYKIPAVILRLSNVFGPGQSPLNKHCGVVGKFIYSALEGEPVEIYGDENQTRDYTFINDVIEALLLCSSHPNASGEIYNVGTETETSVLSLLKTISLFIPGIRTEIKNKREIDNIKRRYVSIKKINQHLGWKPKYNLETGIKESLTYYENLHNAEKLFKQKGMINFY